ncbi:MAG TPA: hypothetical protein GXX65_07255 [Methanosarcina sp.]|nr:hypothetical protein [Methanosarcina sp.]
MENTRYIEQNIPLFPFSEPNKSAIVGKDEILIKDKNRNILLSGNAEFHLDFLPTPQIHVYVTNKKELSDSEKSGLHVLYDKILFENLFEMTSKKSGNQFEGFVINSDLFDLSGPSLTFTPSSEPIVGLGDEDTQMQYVIFHLFNFREICVNKGRYYEAVHIEADNWVIEIKSLAKSESNFKKLKKEGGYGLTHIVCLQKIDSTFFSGKETIEMLNMLQYFFSFANGAWCNPICAVGFNSTGRVWELWSSPRGPSFSRSESWFDEHHSEQLENLFPGFMRCWFNDCKNEILRKAIYWYLNAVHSNVDIGIVLTQAAFEGMSRGYNINILKKEQKRNDAEANIRMLFSSLKLPFPTEITEDTPELKRIAEELKWNNNTLGAIILVRNSLVHPQKKYHEKFNSSMYYETWKLGLWYLELSLLKLCDYSGTYCNRLTAKWIGEVEKVPWEK